jgi:fructose-bisphosphate aldolase (EC 4.1.2.13)
MKKYKPGVLFGEELLALYKDALENQFALPAVNTIGTNSINAVLETAAKVNSPVIIQFSNGGAQFIAGKGMPNDNLQANIAGGISGALHVHNVAKYYGVPVVLHTDHAAKKWLPWVSGLIDAGEQFFKEKNNPFSVHTCSTCLKSRSKKTLQPPWSFSNACSRWVWPLKLSWA